MREEGLAGTGLPQGEPPRTLHCLLCLQLLFWLMRWPWLSICQPLCIPTDTHVCLSMSVPYHLHPMLSNHVFLSTPRGSLLRLTPAGSRVPPWQSQTQHCTLVLRGNRAQDNPRYHVHPHPNSHSAMLFYNIHLVPFGLTPQGTLLHTCSNTHTHLQAHAPLRRLSSYQSTALLAPKSRGHLSLTHMGFPPYRTFSERVKERHAQTCTSEPYPQNTDFLSYTKPSLLNEGNNPSPSAAPFTHRPSPCIRLLHLLLTPHFRVLIEQCNLHSNLASQEPHLQNSFIPQTHC